MTYKEALADAKGIVQEAILSGQIAPGSNAEAPAAPSNLEPRVCRHPECVEIIAHPQPYQYFCSDKCRWAQENLRRRAWRKVHPKPTKNLPGRSCAVCGGPYKPLREDCQTCKNENCRRKYQIFSALRARHQRLGRPALTLEAYLTKTTPKYSRYN